VHDSTVQPALSINARVHVMVSSLVSLACYNTLNTTSLTRTQTLTMYAGVKGAETPQADYRYGTRKGILFY